MTLHKVLTVAIRGVLLWACILLAGQVEAQQLPPTLVVTDHIQTMEFRDQLRLVGRTSAWVKSRVVAEVSGKVSSIAVGEGVPVAEGTPLVAIDDQRIGLELRGKESEAHQAQLRAGLAETNLKRTQELFGRSLVSQTAADSAAAWAAIQQEQFNQLEAERQKMALDLDHCVIKAPFYGYTGKRLVDVGEWVNAGTPVFEMVDLSRVRVTVDLPERYFGHLTIGSPVGIMLASDSTVSLSGIVSGIAAAASEETHTFPVTVTVPNKSGRLGGGMLVRATLTLTDRISSLAVSKDAIIREGLQTLVYTVVDGKAAPIPVVTSSTDGKMIAVSGAGLEQGMPVVVRGNERIFPGSPVRIAEGGEAGASPATGAPAEN